MSAVQIRSVQDSDLPQIRAINSHYILHTALTFAQTPPPQETYHAKLTDLAARGLPYLVAVASAEGENVSRDMTTNEGSRSRTDEVAVGYAYLSPFRGHLTAYAPTVELSLFLHPSHYSQGIGSRLLAEILGLVQGRKILHRADYEIGSEDENDSSIPRGPHVVENIIAVMAVDPEGKDNGEALRKWYNKRGFQERGRLQKVGLKRGHWYVSSQNLSPRYITKQCHINIKSGSIRCTCNFLLPSHAVCDLHVFNSN